MPRPGCVRHPRISGRGTHVRALGACVLLAIAALFATPSLAAAGAGSEPERCERADGEPGRCVGPVTDESGGGGDALTIALGIVVGVAIAGVAFVLVRRQLAKPPTRPAGPPRPRTPS